MTPQEEINYIVALLEQIAFNTQKGPYERPAYLERIRNGIQNDVSGERTDGQKAKGGDAANQTKPAIGQAAQPVHQKVAQEQNGRLGPLTHQPFAGGKVTKT